MIKFNCGQALTVSLVMVPQEVRHPGYNYTANGVMNTALKEKKGT